MYSTLNRAAIDLLPEKYFYLSNFREFRVHKITC